MCEKAAQADSAFVFRALRSPAGAVAIPYSVAQAIEDHVIASRAAAWQSAETKCTKGDKAAYLSCRIHRKPAIIATLYREIATPLRGSQ